MPQQRTKEQLELYTEVATADLFNVQQACNGRVTPMWQALEHHVDRYDGRWDRWVMIATGRMTPI